MYRKTLKRFFKENTVYDPESPSLAAIAHFQIKILLDPENGVLQEFMKEIAFAGQDERKEASEAQKAEIEALASASEVTRFMRRSHDVVNQAAMLQRGLDFKDEVVPQVIRMLKTSFNTSFIESAIRLLSACGEDVADELVACFDEIRNPYAQLLVILSLGFNGGEAHIPWLIEQYKRLKRDNPDEADRDCAYYALDEIDVRIYGE